MCDLAKQAYVQAQFYQHELINDYSQALPRNIHLTSFAPTSTTGSSTADERHRKIRDPSLFGHITHGCTPSSLLRVVLLVASSHRRRLVRVACVPPRWMRALYFFRPGNNPSHRQRQFLAVFFFLRYCNYFIVLLCQRFFLPFIPSTK